MSWGAAPSYGGFPFREFIGAVPYVIFYIPFGEGLKYVLTYVLVRRGGRRMLGDDILCQLLDRRVLRCYRDWMQ